MMDQIEFENLVEKLKKRKEEGDIKTAIKVANKIPWDEVEDVNLLMYVANIYDEGENYKDAKLILEYAYEIAPVKNRLYFALCLINAKCKELKDAISYFIDFDKSFPDDIRKKILEYYILKAKNAPLDQLKRVLSEYLSEEKDEKMSFELALICEKMGEINEVIEICNFIVDFFGVKKSGFGKNALLLKKKHTDLSAKEEDLLLDAEIGYVRDEDRDIEFKEPLKFYNDVRPEEERTNLVVEKVVRENTETVKNENEDELNEDEVPKNISISYTPDEESYVEKEKNKMAFLSKERDDKEKLRTLIKTLKEEEKIQNSEFNKFRQKSFERVGRFKKMKLSDTKVHMIIEAHSKDEGVEIAKKELEYIHSVLNEKVSIAKASAYNMNEKGFNYYAEKVKDKDLIIENAGQLKNELLDDIEEYIINKRGKTVFALVDLINNFDKIATERPAFIGRFDIYSVLSSRPQETLNASQNEIDEFKAERDKHSVIKSPDKKEVVKETDDRVASHQNINEEKNENNVRHTIEHNKVEHNDSRHIESDDDKSHLQNQGRKIRSEMTIDEFVDECKTYAKSIDCTIPGDSIPALYEKVEDMQGNNITLNKENAEALIEEVADRAEKPKLFKKPKYDKDDCLILQEEHFNF
ncbi:MAG: hypothetical protein J6M39_08170 [Lachnospiraceae bacterium]|nr:hypothetical protein [Lachnospiraceae bacterium]